MWSAEIYLMFCLARPDVLPAGDLGIQKGLQRYLGLLCKPDENETRLAGERFAPHRTAASLLLWHLNGMPQK
jgi:DNA-3-methyladenine glycosylase II